MTIIVRISERKKERKKKRKKERKKEKKKKKKKKGNTGGPTWFETDILSSFFPKKQTLNWAQLELKLDQKKKLICQFDYERNQIRKSN